jgi:hypothetical protein
MFVFLQTSATTDRKSLGALVFAGFALKLDEHCAVLEKNTTLANATRKLHRCQRLIASQKVPK